MRPSRGETGGRRIPPIDPTVPNQARVIDYLLGGHDNFEADRELARQIIQTAPDQAATARSARDFLARAVGYLAGKAGISQFLDIGTGLATAGNTHEVAQAVTPDSRVVYVDNDPVVLAHARALLTSSPQGTCAYLDADANDPDRILALAADTIDFARPVAVTMFGILHVLADPYAVVRAFARAVPSGSYLAIAVPASDIDAARQAVLLAGLRQAVPDVPITFWSRPEVEKFFDGLELVVPGITTLNRWRPAPDTPDREVAGYGALARKP